MFQNENDERRCLMKEKLTALREKMLQNNLFGFVLPATDAYRSDYVTDENNRLKWLTGFSGSD